jgi:hypothetical protein
MQGLAGEYQRHDLLDDLFGCVCVPYLAGRRPCVEVAYVMPFDVHADVPHFGYSDTKTVWETAADLTFMETAA